MCFSYFCETARGTPFCPAIRFYSPWELGCAGGLEYWSFIDFALYCRHFRRYCQLFDRTFYRTKVFHYEDSRFSKRNIFCDASVYEKHGGKTIIIAQFMPIIRTFAPFVAGVGAMTYSNLFCLCHRLHHVGLPFLLSGYFFGNIPSVKSNFTIVIMRLSIISVMPGFLNTAACVYF